MAEADLLELDRLIGTWQSNGRTDDNVTIEGRDNYEWLPGKKFVVHRVDVDMGDDHVDAIEIIGGHDEATGSFGMHGFQGDGTRSTMQARKQTDGVWLFSGDESRSTLTIHADGTRMDAVWERREDERWVHWMDMHFRRLA